MLLDLEVLQLIVLCKEMDLKFLRNGKKLRYFLKP